jgi:[NiFe] hydrogenase diaphorase moiety large subunit
MKNTLIEITAKYGNGEARLMDILMDTQSALGYISEEAIEVIAEQLKISTADVVQTASFYHFFALEPRGKYSIYLNNSVTSVMFGYHEIADAFVRETGCKFGKTTADGLIGLYHTACIGMCDQEPAAIINDRVFTKLTPAKVAEIVKGIKAGKKVEEICPEKTGDGNNANPLVKAMVNNNIRKTGAVIFTDYTSGTGLKKAVGMSSQDVINEVKNSNLRGRGGAGFPTGMKWEFCSKAEDSTRYVLCNADEGEPGTFKDRVLLTEKAKQVFEGMAIGGYAVGAKTGVLYLRAEYRYLKAYLESVLDEMRQSNLLGKNAGGKAGFDFDIRIQFGAGAYVCGEESALIESAEGHRGEPRNRPPFPVTRGYLAKPTIVNNVETFCAVTRIIEKGSAWYTSLGTQSSAGTKVLSISGDCDAPGIYEIEWGMTIKDMLSMVGAKDTMAVQVAGPSGICLNPEQFDRKIAFEDLPTGGSMIVIGKSRNLIKDIVLNFMEFFAEESCGSCVTCRSLNVVLKQKIEKILAGNGVMADLEEMEKLGKMMYMSTRCGLGQTSSNPITTTLQNFRNKYTELVRQDTDYVSEFNMAESVKNSCNYVKRTPHLHE